MKKKTILTSILALAAACALLGLEHTTARESETTAKANGAIVTAADNFLVTLSDEQRGKVVYDFKDDAQRRRWSNFPTTFVQRGGIKMGDLTQTQRDAAMGLLKATLSAQGYEKVQQIMQADETLKNTDGGRGGGPGGGGGGAMFGKDLYYISILGKPSTAEPWMLQFGGHHLGLNITMVGDQGTMAPSHVGAQPAHYELEGKMVRPLGQASDKAYALMSSLSIDQSKKALLGFEMRDLVLGPGRDGQTIAPEGIKGSDLTAKQQAMLLDLAGEWTNMMNESAAKAKMEEIKKNIGETWFAWSGLTDKGAAAYFRIQGPAVFIEYAPQGLGGDPTNHIHTIYRDPTNEYGAKWTKS